MGFASLSQLLSCSALPPTPLPPPCRVKVATDNTEIDGCVSKTLRILKFEVHIIFTYYKILLNIFFNYLKLWKPFLACRPLSQALGWMWPVGHSLPTPALAVMPGTFWLLGAHVRYRRPSGGQASRCSGGPLSPEISKQRPGDYLGRCRRHPCWETGQEVGHQMPSEALSSSRLPAAALE